MSHSLEGTISKSNVIDLLGQFLYSIRKIPNSEIITEMELSDSGDTVFYKIKTERELEVTLIEHYGKKLQEGSSVGGQTRTGETP